MNVQFTFQFQISKEGREICEFEMHLKNFFGWNSNLCNDDIISAQRQGLKKVWILDVWSKNGCGK